MQRSEYARIKISNIPQDFIDEYDFTTHKCYGCIYLEIFKGCYGLLQAGKLDNDLIRVSLKK